MKWWDWDSNSVLIQEPVLILVHKASFKIFMGVQVKVRMQG